MPMKKLQGEVDEKPGTEAIFVIVDDDAEATNRMIRLLTAEWYYIPVSQPRLAFRYAKQFATAGIFLADQLTISGGNSMQLLCQLVEEVRKPVVILAEPWSPNEIQRWKDRGAYDCIPHPTRTGIRIKSLKEKMRELSNLSVTSQGV